MPGPSPAEITRLLVAWREGDQAALAEARDWRLAKVWLLRELGGESGVQREPGETGE